MAEFTYQVALHGASNLPEDDHVNVLYYETDNMEATMDQIAAAYVDNSFIFNGFYSAGMTIKSYELAGGQPLLTKDYAFSAQGGTGPTENACCLSYQTVDDANASTPRRRGRIYIGAPSVGVRPSLAYIEQVRAFGEDLGAVGVGSAQTWLMFSRTDNVAVKIESIAIDDAWDTQRRRGLAPTARYVYDVQ